MRDEGPGAFRGSDADILLIGAVQQAVFERAIRRLVNHLNRAIANWNDSDDAANGGGFEPGGNVFEDDHFSFMKSADMVSGLFVLRLPVPQHLAEDDGVGEISALKIYIGEELVVECGEQLLDI